jgi:hypothetical protein
VLEAGRVRGAGGGRRRLADADPKLLENLERLADDGERGDPQRPLRWCSKSQRRLAEGLRSWATGSRSADCGGSNGIRTKLWKVELQKLADQIGLPITVCHFPPATSKWNRIEHLFSHISMNWRGKPLISHQVIISLIAATTTRTGLKVHACIDDREYPKAIKVTNAELAAVNLAGHQFHPKWTYRIAGINRRGERNERVRH